MLEERYKNLRQKSRSLLKKAKAIIRLDGTRNRSLIYYQECPVTRECELGFSRLVIMIIRIGGGVRESNPRLRQLMAKNGGLYFHLKSPLHRFFPSETRAEIGRGEEATASDR